MYTRRHFLTLTAAAPVILAAATAQAAEPRVYQDAGIAINGYDPVAYFTDGKPVQGAAQFSSGYDGATFLFASANHKALFDENPSKYAPQYGGYCAFAVANGYTDTFYDLNDPYNENQDPNGQIYDMPYQSTTTAIADKVLGDIVDDELLKMVA